MSSVFPVIGSDAIEGGIDWLAFSDAILAGHRLPRAELADVFLGPPGQTTLSRAARIEGLGSGVKKVTAMAQNPSRGLPFVHGAMLVFDDETGAVRAVIDSALLTNIKTVADSLLGARMLARPDSKSLLIVGAGSVCENLLAGYLHCFEQLERVAIWNRTAPKAIALAEKFDVAGIAVQATTNLAEAVADADIVASATMTTDPILQGAWFRLGTHVDLIGAFRPEMREADDALLQRSRIVVDSRETTLDHIGELKIPLSTGAITREAVLADFYDLADGALPRSNDDDITLFKNGGGAHLDLMVADAILNKLEVA